MPGDGPVGVWFGLGRAMVYPTFLAAVSDVAHPLWHASAVGVYRLWRDLGYAVGAVLAGLLADHFGAPRTIAGIAAITFVSGVVVLARMHETLHKWPTAAVSTSQPPAATT